MQIEQQYLLFVDIYPRKFMLKRKIPNSWNFLSQIQLEINQYQLKLYFLQAIQAIILKIRFLMKLIVIVFCLQYLPQSPIQYTQPKRLKRTFPQLLILYLISNSDNLQIHWLKSAKFRYYQCYTNRANILITFVWSIVRLRAILIWIDSQIVGCSKGQHAGKKSHTGKQSNQNSLIFMIASNYFNQFQILMIQITVFNIILLLLQIHFLSKSYSLINLKLFDDNYKSFCFNKLLQSSIHMVQCIKNVYNFMKRLMEISLPFKVSFCALIIVIVINSILSITYISIGCQIFPFPISCSTSIPNNPHHCFSNGDFCCGQTGPYTCNTYSNCMFKPSIYDIPKCRGMAITLWIFSILNYLLILVVIILMYKLKNNLQNDNYNQLQPEIQIQNQNRQNNNNNLNIFSGHGYRLD